jgi:hypothetical protein
MLMWSYYADGHKGAAVRFGMDLDRILALGTAFKEQGTDLFPVEVDYEEEFELQLLHRRQARAHQGSPRHEIGGLET